MKKAVSAIILICLVYSLGCGRAIVETPYGTYDVNPWDELVFETQKQSWQAYYSSIERVAETPIVRIPMGKDEDGKQLYAEVYRQMELPPPPKIVRIPSANEQAVVAVATGIKDMTLGLFPAIATMYLSRENRKSQEALMSTLGTVFSDIGGNVYDSYNTTTNTTEDIDRTVTTNTTETTYGANSGNTGDFHVGDVTRTKTDTDTTEGSYNQPDNGIYESYNSTDDNHTEDNSVVRPEVIQPVVPIVPTVIQPVVTP